MEIGDDTIDSRDVMERIEELRQELGGTPFANEDLSIDRLKDLLEETPDEWREATAFDPDDVEELIRLLEFAVAGEYTAADWEYGATFILGSYFKEYAQELAEDIGAINRDARWPNDCIDWDQAADELKADYSTVEVGKYTYYVRA